MFYFILKNAASTAKGPTKPRFVVGSIGEDLLRANRRSCGRRIRFFMVETIFDTLNAKAAMYAVGEILKFSGLGFLGFITGTLVEHLDVRCRVDQCDILCLDKDAKPMCESLNSSRLRTQHLVPFVEKLANFVECFMHVKSNAGLPYNRRV
jgi:methionine synthase I (cobalamin-dependent)